MSGNTRRRFAIIVASTLPTLFALIAGPRLILDDLQFARIARFEGFGGFADEMSYRPGQGLIHGLQFVLLGEHGWAHLLVLATVGAAVALAFDRLARRWLSPTLATAATVAWLILPNRGSTRFWASTVPNHVALLLLLVAAMALIPAGTATGTPIDPRNEVCAATTTRWVLALGALIAAILTYEAVAVLAAAVVVIPLMWDRSRAALARTITALVALGSAAAFVLVRSPRADASGFLPAPLHGLGEMATSVGRPLLGSAGWLLVVALSLWVVLERRSEFDEHRRLAVAGVAIAMLGLTPFLVAGFNINDLGVLDRSFLFADLGLALVIAPVLAALYQRPLLGRASAVAIGVALSIGMMADLAPFAQSWHDQAGAYEAFSQWPEPDHDVVLVDMPLHAGVGWAHYRVQVTDLYQLANDDERYPEWLGFRLRSVDTKVDESPVIIIDGEVAPLSIE